MATPLLTLTAPDRSLDREILDTPGGFAWWYADILDEHRNGLVLIWSFGLPFLPGYLSSVRAGRPQRPAERPAVNVVVYRRGKPVLYALGEHAPGDLEWSADGSSFRVGRSTFRTRAEAGQHILHARLDEPCPGGPLRGEVEILGPPRALAGAEPRDVDPRFHAWTPLTACAVGRAELSCGDARYRVEGRAYHDRNGSRTPFDRLGIATWIWGRAALPSRELLWYLLWPARGDREATFLGVEVDRAGRTRVIPDLSVQAAGTCRGLFGLGWPRTLSLSKNGEPWLEVEHVGTVDDGPFYARSFLRARSPEGETGLGTGEVCVPPRVDRARERPFVSMRVHRAAAPTSVFHPLFAGPREGRLSRFAAGLWRRSAPTGGAD